MMKINGSKYEGGGSILRLTVAISAITGKPVKIFNIRKNRPVSGLKAQHLEGIKAVSRLSNAVLKGANIGSTEIEFHPKKINTGKLHINIGTAGSIGLLFQSLELLPLKTTKEIKLYITGGATFGKFSPPLIYVQNVLLRILKTMNYKADIRIKKHGFYPIGGAKVSIILYPCRRLKALNLTDFGEIEYIHGVSIASEHLKKSSVCERQADACRNILLENTGVGADIKTQYVNTDCPGSGIVLWATTTTGAVLGSDGLGEKRKTAELVGKEAAKKMIDVINSKSTVDPYLSDQIIPFMAFSNKTSSFLTSKLTLHTKTNIWLVEMLTKAKFTIQKSKNNVIIKCDGSGIT